MNNFWYKQYITGHYSAFLLCGYILSLIVHSVFFVVSYSYAETPITKTNLIAVFVDQEIQPSINTDLKRYTTSYIQQRYPDTKALVIPIDIVAIKAPDITKIIENIYFDGLKDTPSQLKGIILIGDIPLPVVKREEAIFPSILPYVDMEGQQFLYNLQKTYFEWTNQTDSQPELRHGVINFTNNIAEYKQFFAKLRTYEQNPTTFVSRSIRYDDFPHLKQSFNPTLIQNYLHQFIHAEDLGYHRYTDSMVQLFNSQEQEKNKKMLTQTLIDEGSTPITTDEFTNTLDAQIAQATSTAETTSSSTTPTLLLGQTINNFLKTYSAIISPVYLSTMRDNSTAGGRRGGLMIDSHISKMELQDDLLSRQLNKDHNPLLIDINNKLEEAVNNAISISKPYMNIPVTTQIDQKTSEDRCFLIATKRKVSCSSLRPKQRKRVEGLKRFQVFFFGKNAESLTSAQETSIYRGTYRSPLMALSGQSTTLPLMTGTIPDPQTRSVGASRGINNRQTINHRGYNILLAQKDESLRQQFKDSPFMEQCPDGVKDDVRQFVQQFWGGVSPINLTQGTNGELSLGEHNLSIAREPYITEGSIDNPTIQPTGIGGRLFDPAGSKILADNAITGAYDHTSIERFASVQKITELPMQDNLEQNPTFSLPNICVNRELIPYQSVTLANIFNKPVGSQSKRTILANKQRIKDENNCPDNKCLLSETFHIKTIDSRVLNNAPTPDYISGMNITTQDRAVDSVRYLTFLGLGGDTVTIPMPNLYEVPVYKANSQGVYELLSPIEINKQIRQYLKNTISSINNRITEQNNKRTQRYLTQRGLFDALGAIDPLSTPIRSVPLLDENQLITLLGTDTIDIIARQLYLLNSPWPTKPGSNTLDQQMSSLLDQADISHKIQDITKQYLSRGQDDHPLKTPGYNKTGYEALFFVSDGIDSLAPIATPSFIDRAISNNNNFDTSRNLSLGQNTNGSFSQSDNQECNIEADGGVRIDKRPDAFACWLRKTLKKPLSLSINFNNAQGPVFMPGDRGGYIQESTINGNTTQQIQTYSSQRSQSIERQQESQRLFQSLPEAQQSSLQDIRDSLRVSFLDTYFPLETVDNTSPAQIIRINSLRKQPPVTLSITSTGDSCLSIGGTNTCQQPFTQQLNLNEGTTQDITMGFNNQRIGDIFVTFKICQSPAICYEREETITRGPGLIHRTEILTPTTSIIPGVSLPIVLRAYDRFNNPISQQPQSFALTTTTGTFSNGLSSIKISSFDNAGSRILTPTTITQPTTLTVSLTQTGSNMLNGKNIPTTTKQIRLTPATLAVRYLNQALSSGNRLTYQLPSSSTGITYKDAYNISHIKPSSLVSLTIQVVDTNGQPLTTPATIRSTNNHLSPGVIVNQPTGLTGRNAPKQHLIFKPQTSYDLGSGTITVSLYPLGTAGSDTIIIEVPGLNPFTIPIEVLPANPERVDISVIEDSIAPGRNTIATITISDRWGNSITTPQDLRINAFGSLALTGGTSQQDIKTTTGSTTRVSLTTLTEGGTSYISAYLRNIPLSQQRIGYQPLHIKKQSLPTTGLNVLYATLAGQDRGNQWGYFSDHLSGANDLIASSPKLLSVTTLLTDPQQLKPFDTIIRTNLTIHNPQQRTITLQPSNNNTILSIQGIGRLTLDQRSTTSLMMLRTLSGLNTLNINQPTLVYIPSTTDSIIRSNILEGGSIIINGQSIRDIKKHILNADTKISYSGMYLSSTNQQRSQRIITHQGKTIGTIYLGGYQQSLSLDNTTSLRGYRTTATFGEGSTNGLRGIGRYDPTGSLDISNQHPGVEQATDSSLFIGFRADSKHLSYRAAGQSVGEATRPFGSAFMINRGDPLLVRSSATPPLSGTHYDTSLGTPIYTSPDKTIQTVLPGDINNDTLEDTLVIHTDGSVKLIKQSPSGTMDVVSDLMLIPGGIKQAYIGDTAGDGYDDIILWTNNNTLKVYNNNRGIIDVDGTSVCLDIPGGPDNIGNLEQLFVKDMDNDGSIDIITNDNQGAVTIFYGGSSAQGPYYLSTSTTGCDTGWRQRQISHKKVIKHLGITLNSGALIRDDSLVRRQGLQLPSTPDAIDDNGDLTNPLFNNFLNGGVPNLSDLNTNKLVGDATATMMRYIPSPIADKPRNETLSIEDIRYIPLSQLNTADQVVGYKTYTQLTGGLLFSGDVVRVTVHLQADRQSILTYIDHIEGPRTIELDTTNLPLSLTGINTPTIVTPLDGSDGYQYMVDGISLSAGQQTSWSYNLIYQGSAPYRIDITKKNADTYRDVDLYAKDSCDKNLTTLVNTATLPYRSYREEITDLSNAMSALLSGQQANNNSGINNILNQLGSLNTSNPGANNPPFLNSIREQRSNTSILNGGSSTNASNMINNFLQNNGKIEFNLNLGLANQTIDNAEKALDDTLQGLCRGFSLNKKSCGGLPLPFNMAFLAPGNFNVMGCHVARDPGLPIFHFPGTIYIPTPGGPIPIPFPRGLKGPGDSFIRPGGGTYPSNIRIYAAPTTTMQIGIAICLGPMAVGRNLPPLVRDLGGNCIVTAIPMPMCRGGAGDNNGGLGGGDSVSTNIKQLSAIGQCPTPLPLASNTNITNAVQERGPFVGVDVTKLGSNNLNDQSNSPAGENSYRRGAIAPGTYLGVINFKRIPQRVNPDTGEIGGTQLRGGRPTNNRIGLGGAIKQTIAKCLIQGRLDNQIKYVINNLTNMTIALYLPDVSDLFQGFDSLSIDRLQQLMRQNRSQFQASQGTTGGFNPFKKNTYDDLSNKISNPFDALSSLFNQVPLVHISTKDISVQIPTIYSEDITRYSSYLETWLIENVSKLKRRGGVINNTFNFCGIQGNLTDPQFMQSLKGYREQLTLESQRLKAQVDRNITGSKEQLELKTACLELTSSQSINALITFQTQGEQAIKAVRQNIRVLEQYKRFPLQLYEWIHITDRYLSELSSVISNTMGRLQQWLKLNAARFEQYTNTIILMIGVIKTWQILIDVSVNWKSQCGTCKNDTYDSYSCSMSFLCPQIPVVRFPPFKIPNIYLDFSHIDINMNIVLPKFNFVPVSIPLPRLPTLPSPPTIKLDTALPTVTTKQLGITPLQEIAKLTIPGVSFPVIPVLPSPPKLPPLPSFIPTIQLDLPVLPPAPRIPNINPDIRSAINSIDKIGKIFCIIKGGIGLVGEATVKSKIEQLTQRTWSVPFFDQMLTQRQQPQPNVGFDYKVDAFVRLQYNFDAVTNLLNGLANQVNNRTNRAVVEPSQGFVGDISNTLNNNSINQTIQDAGNQTINIQGALPEPDDITYEQGLADLQTSLELLSDKTPTLALQQDVRRIQDLIAKDTVFTPNTQDIEQTTQQLLGAVAQKRELLASFHNNQSSPEQLYNKLIAQSQQAQLVDNEILSGTINTSLFVPHESTTQILKTQPDPLVAYLETNQTIAQGYLNALKTNTPEALLMDHVTHQQSTSYLTTLTQRIQQTLGQTGSHITGTQDIPTEQKPPQIMQSCPLPSTGNQISHTDPGYQVLLAQNNVSLNNSTPGGYDLTQLLDMTSNLKGIRVNIGTGEQLNIVQSAHNTEQIGTNYLSHDINKDQKDDIIMRDSSTVYLKQAVATGTTQRRMTLSAGGNKDTTYYLAPRISNTQQLDGLLTDTDGYLRIGGLNVRIRSTNTSVKQRTMQGQTYESLSVSRANASLQNNLSDGYLITYVQRADLAQDRMINATLLPANFRTERYIIVLPQGTDLTGKTISIPGRFDTQLISNLMTGVITQASFVDQSELQHSIRLTDVPRNRHYLRIVTLGREGDNYRIISPGSPQIVGGLQRDADNLGPLPTIELLRPSTAETISRGINLKGLINTNYTLRVKREDKSGIAGHRVKRGSGEQRLYSGNTLLLSGLLYTGKQTLPLSIGASDTLGNKTTQPLTLTITTPSLSISAINQVSPTLRSIVSTLSKDLDTGYVAYQKQQQPNQRITLTGKQQTTLTDRYALAPRQLLITGGFFDIGSQIGFRSPTGTKIANLNPLNGEITIPASVANSTSIRVGFLSHFPIVQLRHGNPQTKQFEMYLPPRSLSTGAQAIELLDGAYTLQRLPSTGLMSYSNGTCITSNTQCVVAVSTGGEISLPSPRHTSISGRYDFDSSTQEIVYTLTNTTSQQPIARIRIIADQMK